MGRGNSSTHFPWQAQYNRESKKHLSRVSLLKTEKDKTQKSSKARMLIRGQ
jgi:hypothetical protein